MPYVPTAAEARRLARAIDRASFSEGERILWLTAFGCWVALSVYVLLVPSWIGALGAVGAFLVLVWRLRGGQLILTGQAGRDRDLYGMDLRTRDQRAFTALMLRHAVTGRNPLTPRPEHDPLAEWRAKAEKGRAP